MAKPTTPTAIRFNDEDIAILKRLHKKLGLGTTPLIRLALRRLYELEIGK